jgi:hypothetical protein
MAPRTVYVHVGPLKTGTTYIQGVLWGNQAVLAEQGVCLPLKTFGQQTRAVLGLLDKRMHRDVAADPRAGRARWQALVEDVQSWDGPTAVLSMEFLCEATAPAVRRLVDDLAPAEVHVLYSARDLVRLVPAMWQTHLRNKRTVTWSDYLGSLQDPGDPAQPWGRRFWSQQDPAEVLGRWQTAIPAKHMHVVTVPGSSASPDLLWRRFASVLGVDPGPYDLDVPRANRSLGAVECEALRRLNASVAERIPGPVYADLVKRFVARDVLEREPNEHTLVLPPGDAAWVRERSAGQVATLRTGYDVVGDLDELVADVGAPPAGWRAPDDVDEADVVALLARLAGEVVVEMARRQRGRRWTGPRSTEAPQPSPQELGLTGVSLLPGGRRHGGAAAQRAVRTARLLARRLPRRPAR